MNVMTIRPMLCSLSRICWSSHESPAGNSEAVQTGDQLHSEEIDVFQPTDRWFDATGAESHQRSPGKYLFSRVFVGGEQRIAKCRRAC
jgi:hypothetical protein